MVSWIGIAATTVLAFVIGGLWYSPLLFGKAWMAANGFTEADLGGGAARVFGGSFALSLVVTTNLAFFIGAESTVAFGAAAGAAAGIGWVGASLGVLYLFERKPLSLFLINAGYNAVVYTLSGAILAATAAAGLP